MESAYFDDTSCLLDDKERARLEKDGRLTLEQTRELIHANRSADVSGQEAIDPEIVAMIDPFIDYDLYVTDDVHTLDELKRDYPQIESAEICLEDMFIRQELGVFPVNEYGMRDYLLRGVDDSRPFMSAADLVRKSLNKSYKGISAPEKICRTRFLFKKSKWDDFVTLCRVVAAFMTIPRIAQQGGILPLLLSSSPKT